MEWYYSKDGAQNGPINEMELKQLIANGTVQGTDLAWNESMTDWTPVSQIQALAAPAAAPTTTGVTQTSAQGTPYQTPSAQQPSNAAALAAIPNYLWQSICVTLFCCLIGGIVAIIHAVKVDGFKQAGDYNAALEASNTAKKWCLWSFIIGLVLTVAYIALMFMAGWSGYQG